MKKLALVFLVVVSGCMAGADDPADSPGNTGNAGNADRTAQATPPAPENPADFVLTPSGYYHKDCVIDVGEDATIENDGTVVYADGRSATLPACSHPHFASLDDLRAGVPAATDATVPATNGWVNDLYKWAPNWFSKISSSWSVPTRPPHDGGQTVFLWPGFEPNGIAAVVQPVLQYGGSAAGGGNYWAIASWYCTSTICPHTTAKRVSVGDIIDGSVTGSSCTSSGVCTWRIVAKDRRTGTTTVLSRRDPHPMRLAVTVLEVWNLTRCDELPSSNGESFDVTVYKGDRAKSFTNWSKWKMSSPSPRCGYGESSPDHAHTYLFWND